MKFYALLFCLFFCVGCGKPPKKDVNGDFPSDVFRNFIQAVDSNSVELARSFWDDIPHEVNGGGRGTFSEEFQWWRDFDEIKIVGSYQGKTIKYDPTYYHYRRMSMTEDITYYHVVTECFKDGEKIAGPHPGLYLLDGTWKIHRNISW